MPFIHMPLTNRQQCSNSNVQLCRWCAEADCCDNITPGEAIENAKRSWEAVDMVAYFLATRGYEGLYNEAGCGCQLSELAPCGEMTQNCEAAFLFACTICAKRQSCDIADEEQPYLMSTDKDLCKPDYTVAAPAAAFAADGAALPACAPLTVGEAVFGVDYANAPDWYAQGGIGEAPEDALKIEPGEVIMPIADMAEVIAKAIKDSAPKPKPAALAMPLPAKEVCQNTAKTEPASRVLKEDRTAEYIRFLEFGA